MSRVVIVYGTTEGQTRKIAERGGNWAAALGHRVEVVDSASVPEGFRMEGADAYILAGSLHQGRHQTFQGLKRSIEAFLDGVRPSA
jgi:menaquinone-dependent protoporphyrinogen oxidase